MVALKTSMVPLKLSIQTRTKWSPLKSLLMQLSKHSPWSSPPAEDAPPEPSKADPENRLIRNKVTGVTFIWTSALSKLSVMEEV